MKTFVATLALIALIGNNVNAMTTSCPMVEPSDFCSQEIQPYHCANTAEFACSANANCCKDGCGKYRCLPKVAATISGIVPRQNPAGCPSFDSNPMCSQELQPEHCANNAMFACPAEKNCCRDNCGKHYCYAKPKVSMDSVVSVPQHIKEAVANNPTGCPAVRFEKDLFCTMDFQIEHCANSAKAACSNNENCCADECGKFYCKPKAAEEHFPIREDLNPAGCPAVRFEKDIVCSMDYQIEHCANSAKAACSNSENCCSDECGKFRCHPKVAEKRAACPAFDPNPVCSQELQPNHCANDATFACPANKVCCENSCGKFHCY